ncbi:hypothetical protein EVG20_g3431 [Dentipellis fragilis]|uniref:F-box domain-containing protein n=1 Tax=Dentipellis fragilis TaxID=205917 RepID=A0A4Y9Z2B2_9AGAM|nr:hypothetical protein EVG20_g3431 [Dentipellis fragilis]
MSTSPNTDHLVRRAFSRTVTGLPDDLLIDRVFLCLSLRDILRLRQVCKLFSELTRTPRLWKQILRSVKFALPPLPPIGPYSFANLGSIEIERLIVCSLTLDANWRSEKPIISKGSVHAIDAHHEVLSMKLLPGGQYMIALVHDAKEKSYALMLFVMGHEIFNARRIANWSVETKPYHIEAKYMPHKGEMGIMIAYVRCEAMYKERRVALLNAIISEGFDETKTVWPFPVRHEVVVLHSSLKFLHAEDTTSGSGSVERAELVKTMPPPFRRIAVLHSPQPLGVLDMAEIDGNAQLFFAKGDCEIIQKDLVTRRTSKLSMNLRRYDYQPYALRAIRVLPAQHEILVVRTARWDRTSGGLLSMEMYVLPDKGPSPMQSTPFVEPTSIRLHEVKDGTFGDVGISGYNTPSSYDGSVLSPLYQHTAPPPLTVYAVVEGQHRIVHCRINSLRIPRIRPDCPIDWDAESNPSVRPRHGHRWPLSVEETKHIFDISLAKVHEQACSLLQDQRIRILPGATRALLVGTAYDDPTTEASAVKLYSFTNAWPDQNVEEGGHLRWRFDKERRKVIEAQRAWVDAVYGVRDRPIALLDVGDNLRESFEKGLVTIAWDEWSGRVCAVSRADPQKVYAFECAHASDNRNDKTSAADA